MKFSSAFIAFLSAAVVLGSPVAETSALEKRAVSQTIYNDLVAYFKYASSTYALACARPSGNTLVQVINNVVTDTQGFIARDDTKKEIVVALRGSQTATDFLTDSNILLVSFTSPGVSPPTGTLVHAGFLTAWNSVASSVIATVKSQLAAHPGYAIATTGHSLGGKSPHSGKRSEPRLLTFALGALSSLAGISLKQNFPSTPLRLFTYGQPRTGNLAYARFVNSAVGTSNIYRGVHTLDGVPTIIPVTFGYAHHATEYWQTIDPASALTVRQCSSSGEDLTCSTSIPSGGINAAHLTYYNIFASTPYCT